MDFITLKSGVLERWHAAAEVIGIPRESYINPIKVVGDPTGKSRYTFGVIFNEYRSTRPATNGAKVRCHMCRMVGEAQEDPTKNLFPDDVVGDLIITPNGFPPAEGASLAISKGLGEDGERPMYTTSKRGGLAEELSELFRFSDRTGFNVYHNSPGAGATIPHHEHWQLTNWGPIYDLVGERYGLDNAEVEPTKQVRTVSTMPDFPFAHLIFDKGEPDRIEFFMKKLSEIWGDTILDDGSIPHSLCQSGNGIMVIPFSRDVGRDMGAGDVAGHVFTNSRDEYDAANYEYCLNKLSKGVFTKRDVDLTCFL